VIDNAPRNLAIALAAGLLIGIERGWRQRGAVTGTRVAGVRTFALLGVLGGLVGLVARSIGSAVAAAIMVGAVAILAISYSRAIADSDDVSATNAIAALLTLCLGMLAVSGRPMLAIAAAAVTTAILALRKELHGFVERLGETDVKALARFAIIAGAILPLLPNARFGPYDAWNPQQLWLVVVLVTGFSFAGYAANRIFGTAHGTLATAIIAGAYSSTAVTASLSHRLRIDGAGQKTLAAGIALATAVMFIRVLILTAFVASSAFVPLLRVIGPATLVAVVAGVFLTRDHADDAEGSVAPNTNPIAIMPALGFLVLVAIMALAARWAEAQFGHAGTAALIMVTGAFDVDAAIVTVGGLRPGAIEPSLAALVLSGAVFANMGVKIGVVALYAGVARGHLALIALLSSSATLALSAIMIWAIQRG
jgi:uncharacterized membrane protein (DUF4010 family)